MERLFKNRIKQVRQTLGGNANIFQCVHILFVNYPEFHKL
jgi:hypothetical protein